MKRLRDLDEPALGELMTTVCTSIEYAAEHCGVERPRFVVVLFNDPEIAQYASNCRREDIIVAMRETADRLERKEDVTRESYDLADVHPD
jgi:hypothetical protein